MKGRVILLSLMIGLAALFLVLPKAPTQAQAGTQTVTLEAVADAYISDGDPATNFGSVRTLLVGYNTKDVRRALVRFDLDEVPRNAVVQEAELRLYLYQPGQGADSHRIQARMVYGDWDEMSVNWENQPNSGLPSASRDVGKSQGWYTWHVRTIVQGWVDRRFFNRGFMLRANDETEPAVRAFASREAPPPIVPPTFTAKLVITYAVATPVPTPTPTPGYRDVGIVRVWADQFTDEGGYTVASGNVRIGPNGQSPAAGNLFQRLWGWLVPSASAQITVEPNFTAGDGTRWQTDGPIDLRGQLGFENNGQELIESVGPGTLTINTGTGDVTYTTARPLVTTLGDSNLTISPTLEVNIVQPVATIKGEALLDLPENAGVNAYVEFEIDGEGNFSGKSSVDLDLNVAGGGLHIEDLRPERDALKADAATYSLPQVGDLQVELTDIVIDAPGGQARLSFAGSADFELPDIDLGHGIFVLTGQRGEKLQARLEVEQPAGDGPTKYKIALTGVLELDLPWQRGDTRVEFTDLGIADGVVTGRVEGSVKVNMFGQEDWEWGPMDLDFEVAATVGRVNGLAVPGAFRYTLKPEWTRLDLSEKFDLPEGTVIVGLRDVTVMTVEPYVTVGSAEGTFTWQEPVGIGPEPHVLTFKNIQGQITYEFSSRHWEMTWRTDVEFNLEAVTTVANLQLIINKGGIRLIDTVPTMTIGVAGLTLTLNDVDFKDGAFSAETGSLKLPASWGGDAFAINDVRIDKDGLHLGGAGGEVNLPDRKIGKVLELTDLVAFVDVRTTEPVSNTTRTLYTVTISGTVKIALADEVTGGASFVGSFRNGKFRGQVDGFNFQVAGFRFVVEHGDWEGDRIKAELFQLELPGKLFEASGGTGLTLHNLTIGGPKGFAFEGGEIAVPDFTFANVGFEKVRLSFENTSDGRYTVAGRARINLETFAVDGRFTVAYKPPSDIALEQISLAFRGSVASGTAIPIVPGVLYVTEVRGAFDLREGTVVISYGGLMEGPFRVANLPIYSADYETTVTLKPCCRYLFVGQSKVLILEVSRTELEVSSNPPFLRFSHQATVPAFLTKIRVTMIMGLDKKHEFTAMGELRATLGLEKGDLGKALGVPIPPRDVVLAEASLAAGKFQKKGGGEAWGARLFFKVGVKLWVFYDFERGKLSGGLRKHNPYRGVPVETGLADAHTDRYRFSIGPSSQIAVAEAITDTSQAREFGLLLEAPGGGAPFQPTIVYRDEAVTLYVVDDPVPGDWYLTVPKGNAVELTGIAPDPTVSELTVSAGTPVSIHWRVDGASDEATARLTAFNEAGEVFPIAEELPLQGTYDWTPTVPNGVYTVTLEASAIDETVATSTAGPIEVHDTAPPAAPAGLSATPAPDGSALIRWNGDAVEPDVVGYIIAVDGVEQPRFAQRIAEYTVGGLAPGTTHAVAVRAYDIAGNVGPAATVTATVPTFLIEALSPAPDTGGAVTPDVRVTFNRPVTIIDITVTDAAGRPPPGHVELVTIVRSDGTMVTYGARFVADGPWPPGTYTAIVHAETDGGGTLSYAWSWSGGYFSTFMPLINRR